MIDFKRFQGPREVLLNFKYNKVKKVFTAKTKLGLPCNIETNGFTKIGSARASNKSS